MSKIVLVSGGFDPLHIGHVRLINAAAEYGAVWVALNSDAWLTRKKGFVFMPFDERREVLSALRNVRAFVNFNDDDGTVCAAIRRARPDYFANGGDRIKPDSREHKVCLELGVKELFRVGGKKVQSSSSLARRTG